MFELRWIVRPGWDGPERVLQYRTMKEVIVYSGATDQDRTGQRREQKWTDWRDVPEVENS
jgi:hypothetical protein